MRAFCRPISSAARSSAKCITIGDDVKTLGPNQSTFVASEEKHRLENATDAMLKLIEIQFGDYLGEDDILRLEDIYERGDPS